MFHLKLTPTYTFAQYTSEEQQQSLLSLRPLQYDQPQLFLLDLVVGFGAYPEF